MVLTPYSINLPEQMMDVIDYFVKLGFFSSRSSTIRHILIEKLPEVLQKITFATNWDLRRKNEIEEQIESGKIKVTPLFNPNKITWESDVKW